MPRNPRTVLLAAAVLSAWVTAGTSLAAGRATRASGVRLRQTVEMEVGDTSTVLRRTFEVESEEEDLLDLTCTYTVAGPGTPARYQGATGEVEGEEIGEEAAKHLCEKLSGLGAARAEGPEGDSPATDDDEDDESAPRVQRAFLLAPIRRLREAGGADVTDATACLLCLQRAP